MSVPALPFRHAVITGACGGLGQALARELLAAGAHVTLVGLNRPVLQVLADLAPGRADLYTADVADSAAMQALAAECMARAGLPDLVVANAGVAGGMDIADADDLAVMRRMLEINLLGPATTFQPFVKVARQTPGARCALVGVASIAGWRGMPGNGAYCASKGGLIRYLESLRAECRGTGLSVHTVSPGYLRTPLTAGNRFAMPGLMDADVAARALLLGVARGREHIVLPRRIGWLSRLLACLPARWHDRILLRQPRKPRPGEAGSTPIPGLATGLARSSGQPPPPPAP
ncbi:MAG: SDR family oxidoreductase [Gammaproteobacteria bacterium]